MKIVPLLFAMAFMLGCSATSRDPEPGQAAPAAATGAKTPAPAPVAASTPTPVAAPVAPVPHEAPVAAQGEVVTTCSRDSDCAVKNVGNCCGYFPACVHKDSATFPEQVKLQCEKTGTMGICGFREISACMCVEGQCAAADGVQ